LRHGLQDTGFLNIGADIIEECQRARYTADCLDQINGPTLMLGDANSRVSRGGCLRGLAKRLGS
jgi:hypothetical protein